MIWLVILLTIVVVIDHIRMSNADAHMRKLIHPALRLIHETTETKMDRVEREIAALRDELRAIGKPLMGHDGTLVDPKASIKVMVDHDLPTSLSDQEVDDFHTSMVGSYALKRDTHGATLHFTHSQDADEFKRRWLA